MVRIATLLLICTCLGCSSKPVANTENQKKDSQTEDGGVVENKDRDQAQKFFTALPKVESAEQEKKLLAEFGQWLRENEYQVEVKIVDGKHDLSCPYFPPVTPWVRHKFLDIDNLKLLPQGSGAG